MNSFYLSFSRLLYIRFSFIIFFIALFVQCVIAKNYAPILFYRYALSSVLFYISVLFFYRLRLPNIKQIRINIPYLLNKNFLFLINNLIIIYLFSFLFLKFILVLNGEAPSLYAASVFLQAGSGSSFISRIFSANMPLGLAQGYFLSCLLIFLLYKDQIRSSRFKKIYIITF